MKKLLVTAAVVLGSILAGCGSSGTGAQDCDANGGACVGVSSCDKGAGFLGDYDCGGGASTVCCFQRCGGAAEDFACCASGATFRPICHDGKLVCASGQTKC